MNFKYIIICLSKLNITVLYRKSTIIHIICRTVQTQTKYNYNENLNINITFKLSAAMVQIWLSNKLRISYNV